MLIATDIGEDAKVVKRQLVDEYKNIFTSTNADTTVHLPVYSLDEIQHGDK